MTGRGADRTRGVWLALAAMLVAGAAAYVATAPLFDSRLSLCHAPVWTLVAAFVVAGLGHAVLLPWLVRHQPPNDSRLRRDVLVIVLVAGCVARLILLNGPLVLEDDTYRYLWDGAVAAHGHDPYQQSPQAVADAPRTPQLARLVRDGSEVLGAINHPDTRTIYPPVAQAAFALAHLMKPWSLVAWRGVALGFDLLLLAGLLALLRACGLSPLWVALYWWHPIALKEISHAGHMEAVLLPLLVWAVVLAGSGRLFAAVALLAAATATKFWPILLLPILLRPALGPALRPTRTAVLLVGWYALIVFALLLPMLRHGFSEGSGFVAFAKYWTTNSAFFPALERLFRFLLGGVSSDVVIIAVIAKLAVAAGLGGFSLWLCLGTPAAATTATIAGQAAALTSALVLVSPAQFPWYTLWCAPFLVIRPSPMMLSISVMIPLYYGSFYFAARDQVAVFADQLVWVIWLPVWATGVVSVCWTSARRQRMGARLA